MAKTKPKRGDAKEVASATAAYEGQAREIGPLAPGSGGVHLAQARCAGQRLIPDEMNLAAFELHPLHGKP